MLLLHSYGIKALHNYVGIISQTNTCFQSTSNKQALITELYYQHQLYTSSMPPVYHNVLPTNKKAGKYNPITYYCNTILLYQSNRLRLPIQYITRSNNTYICKSTMSGVNSVRILKEDLLKEVSRPSGDGRTEKILDILKSLDKVDMNLAILTEVSVYCWYILIK